MRTYLLNDLGDFQTPAALAEMITRRLMGDGQEWQRILEPTCGQGNFIRAVSGCASASCHVQGIERQAHYVHAARQLVCPRGGRVDIHQANLFDLHLDRDLHWQSNGKMLVIVNPPWVTNATLGTLKSENLPQKENLKGVSGIEAMTGSSNFDIAEYIWIKILRELLDERPTVALLCKTSVARNVLAYAHANNWPVTAASLHRINALKWFGAAVDAALFTVEISDEAPRYECPVYPDLCGHVPEAVIGFVGGQMVSDIRTYHQVMEVDGVCPIAWRQGIKHDAASIMELRGDGAVLTNKLEEIVDVETDWVYPLLKSSDLCQSFAPIPRRKVIVPQERVGHDTLRLEQDAPKLWRYLAAHQAHFDKRKSSIYTNQPPFSIFGIGSYSFAPYKIAVAGLTKSPRFWSLAPIDGRPVMLDDTCYFLPCQTAEQVRLLSDLLNSPLCSGLLKSLLFTDSKRPVTKKLLQRIDLMRLLCKSLDEPELSAARQTLAPLISASVSPPGSTARL